MQFTQFLFVALVALFSSVSARGVAAVHNKCGKSMYLWSVGDSSSNRIHLPDRSMVYNETYRSRAAGAGGISIKIGDTPELASDKHTQFEYTVDPATNPAPKVWYDLSNINGNPLADVDYKLEPSDKDCPTVYCPAGQAKCAAVYNKWNDDQSTHACDANSDLVFTLCPDDKDSDKGDDASEASTPAPSDGPSSVVSSGSGVLGESGPPAVKAAAAAAKKLSSGAASKASSSKDSDALKFLHPEFNAPSKRDEHAAAHAHGHAHAHQRMRRSRVFRTGEE